MFLSASLALRVPISKIKHDPDGSRIVFGKVTDDTVDRDQQIVDPDFAATALQDWFDNLGAPVRNMHAGNYPPAGKGVNLSFAKDGPYLRAKIVEPTAIRLLDEGIYRDFSVGIFDPEVVADPQAPGGRIVDGWIGEVSLCDLGSNKNAHLTIAKRASKTAAVELMPAVGDRMTAALTKVANAYDAKAATAGAWYAAFKRDFDPDVGGGVDRDKLDDSDFVIIEDGKRKFPIVTPGDVSDAVSSWGRYKGSVTFEQFRKRLTRLARRKGPAFVRELPANWKEGKKMEKATKIEDDGANPTNVPPGMQVCPLCHGDKTIREGNRECPRCHGDGYVAADENDKAPSAAKDTAVRRALESVNRARDVAIAAQMASDVAGAALKAASRIHKSGVSGDDEKVDDAIDDLKDDLQEVADAQAKDDVDAKPTDTDVNNAIAQTADAVAELAAAQARDEAADAKKAGKAKMKKGKIKKSKAKKAKKAKVNGVKLPGKVGDRRSAGANSPSKRQKPRPARKLKQAPPAAMSAHDVLCPAFKTNDVQSVFPLNAVSQVIDPGWFSQQLAQLASQGRASKSEIGQAFQSLAAAQRLAAIEAPKFVKMRDSAASAFANAYPDVEVKPGLIDPNRLRRGFLTTATSETSDTTSVPTPDLAPSITAGDFQRPPLTADEARPTLTGGESVTGYTGKAKGKSKPGKRTGSRLFYRNADKNEATAAMALLHDHIAAHYPGLCPMDAMRPGADWDSDGQMGSPAEMNARGPSIQPIPSPQDPDGVGTMRPVKAKKAKKAKGRKAGVAKAAKRAEAKHLERLVVKAQKPLVRRQAKLQKRFARERALLQTRLDKALSAPDQRRAARRGTTGVFAPPADPETALKRREAVARVDALKTRMADRNSTVSGTAQEELMRVLSPEQFAKLVVSD